MGWSKRMMARLVRVLTMDRPHDAVGISLFITKAAMVVLTGVTLVFSCLAAIDAESAKCAGSAWLAGYRSGISDFAALPLLSLVMVVAFMIRVTNERVMTSIAPYNLELFRFRSFRITLGAGSVYGACIASIVWFGGIVVFSVMRYNAIGDYCR